MSEPVPVPLVPHWGQARRWAFRFSFAYFALYLTMHGNITAFLLVPVIGFPLQTGAAWPSRRIAEWLGRHVFHLSGIAARWHDGGSGDTAMHWLQTLGFALAALAITVVWSALDGGRPHYALLHAWLRFFLRLTLGIGMLAYGFAKLFPLQMREPTFAILNNTYGNSSPMTLLWTMIAVHPGYEVTCGAFEVIAGILILVRRTATLGAIVSFAVVLNVFLYNLFFDVPVKLYAGHLLLFSAYLLLPELRALWDFFVRRRPAQLIATWVPPASRRAFRISTFAVEAFTLLWAVGSLTFLEARGYVRRRDAQRPTPLIGAWAVDSAEPMGQHAIPASPEGDIWTVLYIDDRQEGFYRTTEGGLWRCSVHPKSNRSDLLEVDGAGLHLVFDWSQRDHDHLDLAYATGGQREMLHLRRLPAPAHYPLLERKFSWVNEWGYER